MVTHDDDSQAEESAAYRPAPMKLYTDVEILELPAMEWLIAGRIPQHSLAVLYAPAGVGKSFVALSLALCVASGMEWLGARVDRSRVVFVAAEGSAGLPARVRAWKAHHGLQDYADYLGVWFVTQPVQLLEPASVARFLMSLTSLDDAPGLIVIDTLARCMVGGDENSSKDVGLAIAALDRICRATGATVLVVHHTRKDGESERGSSALRGAMDTMLSLRGEEGELVLTCEKMKDAAAFGPIPLFLVPMADSCVVTTAKPAWQYSTQRLPKIELAALLVLSSHFAGDGATTTEWLKACDIKERSFYRARKLLVSNGYVAERARGAGKRYTLTDSGTLVVTANCHSTANELPTADGSARQTTACHTLSLESGSTGSSQQQMAF
jgi:hypothetical protein